MSTRSINWWPLLPLMLLAALSVWLERSILPESQGGVVMRHDPDFWVDNFSIKRFSPDGKPSSTLWGLKMTHFPDDDSTLIAKPRLTYHKNQPIVITAATGLIGKDGKQITLVDDINVMREGYNNSAPLHLSTSKLVLFPDTEQGRADSQVIITQGKSIISGSAMDIDNKTGISVLHGPVTGTIQPAPQR